MRKALLAAVIAATILGPGSGAFGGICGDANADSTVNIQDLIYILEHLRGNTPSPPLDSANADCDSTTGITIGDAVAVTNKMMYMEPLECNVTGTYPYPPSTADTIFFPRMLGIPEDIEEVSLPVLTSLQDSVQGLYFPFLRYGIGSNTHFEYTGSTIGTAVVLATADLAGDTSLLLGVDIYKNQYQGRNEFFTINYSRTSAGPGNVVPELIDRSTQLQIAIEKDGELYRPVITYYDVELPPDTLFISPTEVAAEDTVGYVFDDTFLVEFTSTPSPVSFDLTASEPWVVLLDVPPDLETPASVQFTLDATGMLAGVHTATIDVVNLDPDVIAMADHVDITFTLHPAGDYPWGDLNCDGVTNIVDMTLLVAHLFGGGPAYPPCP